MRWRRGCRPARCAGFSAGAITVSPDGSDDFGGQARNLQCYLVGRVVDRNARADLGFQNGRAGSEDGKRRRNCRCEHADSHEPRHRKNLGQDTPDPRDSHLPGIERRLDEEPLQHRIICAPLLPGRNDRSQRVEHAYGYDRADMSAEESQRLV